MYHLFLPFLWILIISGCVPLLDPDKEKDYAKTTQEEVKVLTKVNKRFDRMEGVDVALYLSKEDFLTLFRNSLAHTCKDFSQINTPEFSKPFLECKDLSFSSQKLYSRINFSFELGALKREVFGHLRAEHELHVSKDAFQFKTHFKDLVLDEINGSDPLKENNETKSLINTAVKALLKRLNEGITKTPLRIPVDMNILDEVNGKDIVSSSEFKLHSASAVNMQTKMEAYLTYITEKGVVFLGTSKALKVEKKEASLKNPLSLKDALSQKIDLVLKRDMQISLEVLQKHSSYYVSKAYLSKQMNLALRSIDLRLIKEFFLKHPDRESSFQKNIYFFNKDSLPSCHGLRKDCTKRLSSCERQCGVKFGEHQCVSCNDIGNPFEKVRCMSTLEACKSKEERYVYECHKGENRCEMHNNDILAQCEIENLHTIQECNNKKDKLLFVNDEILLARLKLGLEVENSYIVQRIREISFNKELDTIEVTGDMHISVETKLDLSLTHKQANDINCSLAMDKPVVTHSQVDYVKKKRELGLSSQRTSDGRIFIKGVSQPSFFTGYLKNTPYEKLIEMESSKLECRYQDMPMRPIEGNKLLKRKDVPNTLNTVFGEIDLQFAEEEFSFVISPLRLGTDILLYPTMEAKAIGFSRQAHFY